MTVRVRRALRTVALFGAVVVISGVNAQQGPTVVNVVQLTGLPGVKENAKGKLSVENGNLHFTSDKAISDVSASSILDVVTGSDSQKAVGKTIGMLSMAAPYGGGRMVSLFRKKIDTLTVQYLDADGGLHGAIFTMPVGSADVIKKDLLTQGAHTTAPPEPTASTVAHPSSPSANKEQR
jgi:hemolysin-activating ACP:hemolysin acyltransferase